MTAPATPLIGVFLAVLAPLAWCQLVVAEYALPKLLMLAVGVLVSALGLPRLRRPPLAMPLLACAAVLALTTATSTDRYLSLVGEYNAYTYGVLGLGLCAGLYLLTASLEPEQRELAVSVVLGVGVLVAAYACVQELNYEPFALSAPLPSGRAVSTLGSPVHLGMYLAMLLPLAVARHWWVGAALLMGGLAATLSRGAWLAAAIGVAAYLALAHGRRGVLLVLALSLMGAAVAGPRLHAARDALAKSDVGRMEGWRMAVMAWRERPLLGHGTDTYGLLARRLKTEAFVKATDGPHYHVHAHNEYFQVLATMGIMGAMAYLLLWAWVAALAWNRRDDPAAAALGAGLLALLANTQFNPASLEVYATAAVLAGAIAPASAPMRGLWALRGLAAIGLAAALWLCAADYWQQRGRVAMGRAEMLRSTAHAAILNPCEPKYHVMPLNALLDMARLNRDREPLRLAAARLVPTLRCRPREPLPHYIMGRVMLMRYELGEPAARTVARASLDRAAALDPRFPAIKALRDALRRR